MTRPSTKHDYKLDGPNMVSRAINKNAYKLELQKAIQILEIDLIDA